MSRYGCSGVDDSLLFFFLILILMFCMPSIFGCGGNGNDCASDCQSSCGC